MNETQISNPPQHLSKSQRKALRRQQEQAANGQTGNPVEAQIPQPPAKAPEAAPDQAPAVKLEKMVRTDALELFSQEELDFTMFKTGERKRDDGKVTGLSLTVANRKTVAKNLDLPSKDNRVVEAMLKASDRLKVASIEKMAQIASSQDWTGKAARTSISKDGTLTATFAFKTVKRGPSITKEQLVSVVAGMTDEQRTQLLAAAEALAKEKEPAVNANPPAALNEPEKAPEAPAPEEQTEIQPEQVEPEQTDANEVPAIDNEKAELAQATAE